MCVHTELPSVSHCIPAAGGHEGARAGCPTEGGLRVQGLVVQWREV